MKVKLALGALLTVVITMAVVFWIRGQSRAAVIQAAVPERPSESGMPNALRQRIEKAETEAQQGPNRLAALSELSRLYHGNGYYHEAWACYNGLIAAEPRNPLWPYRLASIVAGYGQLEEATPLYQRALDLDPSYLPAYIRLGDTLIKQNEARAAERVYQRALGRHADNPYALVGMARVAIADDDWQTARRHLEKAIQATSFNIGADLLGDVYEHLGLDTQHEIIMRNIKWGSYADIPDPRLLELMDVSFDAYQVSIAGGWAVHQGDVETGLRYIRRAVELSPDDPNLHYQIAGVYSQLGRASETETHFRRCVELDPTFADAWLGLINLARSSSNPTTVRRLVDTALRNCPDSPSLHIEKANELKAQGRLDQALPYFRRSIELRPHEAVGYIQLARAFLQADRTEAGLEQLRHALRVEPTNSIALTTLALDAIEKGDAAAAEEFFKRMAKQPRITEREMQTLQQRFQAQFGRLPQTR